jgi:hypothetical protein
MTLHDSYLALNFGWSILNQVEASKCSLDIVTKEVLISKKNCFGKRY